MCYVYVLRCDDDSLYAGMTNDVARRLDEHRAGRGGRYTRAHLPVVLVAAWRYPDRSAAMRAEAQFKQLRRDTKLRLVLGRRPFLDAPFAFDVVRELGETSTWPRFCPWCGGPLALPEDDADPAVCTVCERHHYRNAKPCAGALILRAGEVLLLRRTRPPYRGAWDIPGGFLGPEELPWEGAVREVQEEAGLEIQQRGFLGFYSDVYAYQGELTTTLNIYFVAEAQGEPVAQEEADACGWFSLDALPERIAFNHAPQVLADLRRWLAR